MGEVNVYPSEGRAKRAAREDLDPFVVELPGGEGYARFSAGSPWFGPEAVVPRGARALAIRGRVQGATTNDEGRLVHDGDRRRGWEDVRFGKSRPGPR